MSGSTEDRRPLLCLWGRESPGIHPEDGGAFEHLHQEQSLSQLCENMKFLVLIPLLLKTASMQLRWEETENKMNMFHIYK